MTKIKNLLGPVLFLLIMMFLLAVAVAASAQPLKTKLRQQATLHKIKNSQVYILEKQLLVLNQSLTQPKTDTIGLRLIRNFEGFYPFVYKDIAGYDTIGFGHLIKPKETFSTPLTGQDAEMLFEKDVSYTETKINLLLKVQLAQNQYNAVSSFTYNVGTGAFASSHLLAYINTKQNDLVPEQFLKWDHAGGKERYALKTRRQKEAELYKSN